MEIPWLQSRQAQYDALLRALLAPDRVKLWDVCETDIWCPTRARAMDWKSAEIALTAELHGMC